MKRFIRWLSNISGVTGQIQKEMRISIGQNMIQDAYWWSGGLMYDNPMWGIANFSVFYGEGLKEHRRPDISKIRDDVYKMEKQDLVVFSDREIYGYWSDIKTPHFISKEEYKGEQGYTPKLTIRWK